MLRSTPLRITVALGSVFTIAMFAAGVLAWQLSAAELAARLDSSISEDFSTIARTYDGTDVTDLRDLVASHVGASAGLGRIYLLKARDGAVIAGNVAVGSLEPGWSTAASSALHVPGMARYRLLVGDVGGNTLLVGASLDETEAIGRLVMTSLGAALLVLTLVLAAFGILLARRGRHRLAEIADVMHRVGQGELGARLPVSSRSDDIDAVAEQVNAALHRLDGLIESMRQVGVDIAHDLKTPLNRLSITIAGAVSSADSATGAQLARAETEIAQINATFDALLRIAQIEAGSRRARFQPIELDGVLASLADLYGDVAEDAGQRLVLDTDQNLPPISGDRELLTQLFANLIENAIRHAGVGAVVAISLRIGRGQLEVAIADTGPGIPSAERQAVFRRLYRLDRSRTTPGSGLGLSLVKAIAELHAATVRLDDNQPGLRATVTFPAPSLNRA